jgi:Cu(I)/Ag(I) efflux system membrane fusion protein
MKRVPEAEYSKRKCSIPSQAVNTGKEQRVITVDADGNFAEKIHVLHESQQQSGIGSGLEEGSR